MGSVAINYGYQFDTIECCTCGVVFLVSNELNCQWLNTKKSFFCPNGHSQSYTESEADRLRKQLDAAQRDRDWQKSRADSLEKQVSAQKAVTTRLKKRVAAGVCPCCQRTVRQLAAHMKTKHPDYPTSEQGGVVTAMNGQPKS